MFNFYDCCIVWAPHYKRSNYKYNLKSQWSRIVKQLQKFVAKFRHIYYILYFKSTPHSSDKYSYIFLASQHSFVAILVQPLSHIHYDYRRERLKKRSRRFDDHRKDKIIGNSNNVSESDTPASPLPFPHFFANVLTTLRGKTDRKTKGMKRKNHDNSPLVVRAGKLSIVVSDLDLFELSSSACGDVLFRTLTE